jgi:hypothetical protein
VVQNFGNEGVDGEMQATPLWPQFGDGVQQPANGEPVGKPSFWGSQLVRNPVSAQIRWIL